MTEIVVTTWVLPGTRLKFLGLAICGGFCFYQVSFVDRDSFTDSLKYAN